MSINKVHMILYGENEKENWDEFEKYFNRPYLNDDISFNIIHIRGENDLNNLKNLFWIYLLLLNWARLTENVFIQPVTVNLLLVGEEAPKKWPSCNVWALTMD